LQGEREFASDNRTLARFDLTGIPPAPRGVPQIEVEFSIDANGILNVKATDKATGTSQNVEVKGASGLSDDEIEKMKQDAEAHAAEDKARRELVDLKNRAEQIVHSTRKNLEEYGDKVPAEVRSNIESALSNVETKLKEDNKEALESALKELENASMELGKVMYEAQQAEGQAGGQTQASGGEGESADESSSSSGSDDVIDAEYEVKDDK